MESEHWTAADATTGPVLLTELRDVGSEQVHDELLDVGEDDAALLHGLDDRAEVVVDLCVTGWMGHETTHSEQDARRRRGHMGAKQNTMAQAGSLNKTGWRSGD